MAATCVRLHFLVRAGWQLPPEYCLAVCGSIPELGSWVPEQALLLQRTAGPDDIGGHARTDYGPLPWFTGSVDIPANIVLHTTTGGGGGGGAHGAHMNGAGDHTAEAGGYLDIHSLPHRIEYKYIAVRPAVGVPAAAAVYETLVLPDHSTGVGAAPSQLVTGPRAGAPGFTAAAVWEGSASTDNRVLKLLARLLHGAHRMLQVAVVGAGAGAVGLREVWVGNDHWMSPY